MAEWHIGEDLLKRFLRLELTREEAQNVVRHLLAECPRCLELSARVTSRIGLFGSTPEVAERAGIFATVEEELLAVDRLRGWGQWAFLEPLNPQLRFDTVNSDPAYHTLGLYEALLEAGRWYMRREPAEAVDVVRLAVLIAERLDPASFGDKRKADLRSRAWAALGNVKRIAADFEGSRSAFNEAWKILEEEGSNDPLARAELISLEASYMTDLGEFETAVSALEEAFQIYSLLDDDHLQGRILFQMGHSIGHIEPERGIGFIREALTLIDVRREPRLELCARHDLAWYLTDVGRHAEALAVLERARPLYQQFPDASTQLRLHWLEGKIAHSRGDFLAAESIFQWIWEEFSARGLHHELVLVSIDLAQVLVGRGESARAAALVEQSYPILSSWGLHRYALTAWLSFQNALAHQQSDRIFERIRDYYSRHWYRPAAFE